MRKLVFQVLCFALCDLGHAFSGRVVSVTADRDLMLPVISPDPLDMQNHDILDPALLHIRDKLLQIGDHLGGLVRDRKLLLDCQMREVERLLLLALVLLISLLCQINDQHDQQEEIQNPQCFVVIHKHSPLCLCENLSDPTCIHA